MVRSALKHCNSKSFGKLISRLGYAQLNLHVAQSNVSSDPTNFALLEEGRSSDSLAV